MNPYEILRVSPNATDHQIKTAYRARSKETHPDGGGNGDDFAQVATAYHILKDPEARKKFDETGSVDETSPMTVRQTMIQIMAAIFNGALETEASRGTSLEHFDLMAGMRHAIDENVEQAQKNCAKFRKAVADRRVLLKRITRKDDGENLFAEMIRNQLQQMEPLLKNAELQLLAINMAADEIRHYKSEVELIQAVQMMRWGGAYSNSASNASGGVFSW